MTSSPPGKRCNWKRVESSGVKEESNGQELVFLPLATQHYLLLQRNLVYTGVTRGKRLVVLIGQRKALAIAVRNNRAPCIIPVPNVKATGGSPAR